MLIDVECPDLYRAYPKYCSQTIPWLSSDGESTYYKNLKRNREKLEQHNWINRTIEYRFNRYGFRCEEFTDEPGILFLGCSYTTGIGVREEDSFAHIVSRELRLKNFNISRGAASNDTCFRFGSFWIPVLKPKIVVLARPEIARFEIFDPRGVPEASPERWASKFWYTQPINQQLQQQRNISGIKYYCNLVGAKYYEFCGNDVFTKYDENGNYVHVEDLGRDLAHPGHILHRVAADKILKEISNDNRS